MLKRFQTSLRIGIAKTGISITQTVGWRRPVTTTLCEHKFPQELPHSLHEQLDTQLEELQFKKIPVHIVLANDLLRLFMVTPPLDAARPSDCQAAVAMRHQQLYGQSADNYHLSANWDAKQPFLACALEKALLGELIETIKKYQLIVAGIQPQFVTAWNACRKIIPSDAWFAASTTSHMTLGLMNNGQLFAVQSTPLSETICSNFSELKAQLDREALRHKAAFPQALHLYGMAPTPWIQSSEETLKVHHVTPLQCEPDKQAIASDALILAWTGVLS